MSPRQAATLRSRRRATYRDVLEAPPHKVAEIVAGTLHTNPRPAPRHAHASSALGAKIGDPFGYGGGPGGWWILDEPELHLGEDILVPDIAGWRRERMPDLPDTPYFPLAPDWVCEVLSPSTRDLDRHGKRPIYAREGVNHLWFVDPAARATWRSSNCARAPGRSSPRCATTTRFPRRRSRRSPSPSTPSGPDEVQAASSRR